MKVTSSGGPRVDFGANFSNRRSSIIEKSKCFPKREKVAKIATLPHKPAISDAFSMDCKDFCPAIAGFQLVVAFLNTSH
jgi:hypothetical protein